MSSRVNYRGLGVGFLLFAAGLRGALGVPVPDTLAFNAPVQVGNVFSSAETVSISVTTTAEQVAWTVTDFYGAVVVGGPVAVDGNGKATIAPGNGRLGYFALRVTASRQGAAVASADTAFAVLAPVTVSALAGSPFGVCTHYAQGWDTGTQSLMARAGIVQFRDERYWDQVEPTLGATPKYTFPAPADDYLTQAAALGLNPLMELDFENPNYDGGNTPYTAGGLAGYANYALGVLDHYGSQIKSIEIWNEYNGSYSRGPATADKPKFYTLMLKTAYDAIKAARPDVLVAGGACVPLPIPWYEQIFAQGALDSMDAVVTHPYFGIPEGIEIKLASLQTLMAQYNHGNGPKPIWVTECGAGDDVHPGRQEMASYLVRFYTLMLTAGVERAYWYLLHDEEGYTTGLVRATGDPLGAYAPTSGYAAYANLIQQLYGAMYVGREATDPRTRLYRFDRGAGGTQVRVAWSTEGTAQLIVSAPGPVTRVDLMGNSTVLTPANGVVTVAADINPAYLIGPITGVREVGRDVPVANTVTDFGGTQGTSPGSWIYGYYDGDVTAYSANYLSDSFKQMVYTRGDNQYAWAAPYRSALIDSDGEHPSNRPVDPNDQQGAYTQMWVVRRWQSNVAGQAHIVGSTIRSSSYDDGTQAKIFIDGQLVYDALVRPATNASFDLTAPIRVGSVVDLVSTPGPSVNINNDYIVYQAQISIPAAAPATYGAWQEQRFTATEVADPAISGDRATPAGDGVPNLLKYAANLDPKAWNPGAVPTSGVFQASPTTRYLTLTFRQAVAAGDLTFSVEVNPGDLTSASAWTPGGQVMGMPVDVGDGTRIVTYRDTAPIGGGAPQRFMRLRVTRQ